VIRDLTEVEKQSLRMGGCPFCDRSTTEFEARAKGGLSTNYYCPCGAGFNLASFRGQFVAAELIHESEHKPE
jgi:hypothetical protein